jgi:hypothetical protein
MSFTKLQKSLAYDDEARCKEAISVVSRMYERSEDPYERSILAQAAFIITRRGVSGDLTSYFRGRSDYYPWESLSPEEKVKNL